MKYNKSNLKYYFAIFSFVWLFILPCLYAIWIADYTHEQMQIWMANNPGLENMPGDAIMIPIAGFALFMFLTYCFIIAMYFLLRFIKKSRSK